MITKAFSAFKPNEQRARARTRAFFLDNGLFQRLNQTNKELELEQDHSFLITKAFSAFKPNEQRARARTRAFFLDNESFFSV